MEESTKKDKEKDIYLFIIIPKEIEKENQKEENLNELNFTSEIVPEIIHEKEIKKEDGSSFVHRIFKFKRKKEENEVNNKGKEISYTIEYIVGNDVYTIKFAVKENSFVYDIDLKKSDYYINNIVPLNINQGIIPLYNKLEIFLEALQKTNETSKIEKLYEEAIDLYKKEKKFNLLIFLFLRIYEDKNLCSKLLSKLLATFKEIKGLEEPNIDENLGRNLDNFNKIYSNKEFIKTNEYDPITFYGIIICYFYYYDTNDTYFSKTIKELYKENNKVLYEILIMFHSYFLKSLNQDLDFYKDFIGYVIDNKDMKTFKKALNYIKDIETFVNVINIYKEKIFKNYNDLEPITIKSDLKLIKRKNTKNKKNELDIIKSLIENIIDYSDKNKKLLLNFASEFWINLVKKYSNADIENINNCYKLRILFKKYHLSIKYLYKEYNNIHCHAKDDKKDKNKDNEEKKDDKKDKNKDKKHKEKDENKEVKEEKSKDKHKDKDEKKEDKKTKKDDKDNIIESIEKDIEIYYRRDEFTFVLNRNIKDYLIENDLPNDKKLGIIEKYNPYFNIKEEDDEKKYSHNRDVSILDCINFDKSDELFLKTFHKLNLENIFKKNISEFLNKIVSKIKNIANFGTVLDLIDIKRIEDKTIKEYYNLLKNKYEEYIKNEIESITDEKELNMGVCILSKFVSKIYLFENNCNFLDNRISKLDNRIKSLIYNELMKTYKGDDYGTMKDYIFKLFLKKLDNIENIIKLIDSLTDPEDKKKFTKELVKKCKFSKNEFYSNKENKGIKLLYDLNEKEKLDRSCCEEIREVLDEVYKDLEGNLFTKNILEEFLGGEENSKNIIKKLGLIKIVINGYDPKDKYEKLSYKIKEMNNTIKELNEIKKSFSIFHRTTKKSLIQRITNVITGIETKQIYEYDNQKMQDSIKELLENKQLSKDINNVETLLIFKIIFDNTSGPDQEKRFYNAQRKLNEIKQLFKDGTDIEEIYKQNEKIFNKIKDELSKKEESKSKEFINQMIKNLEIQEKYKEDLEIMFKSKKYELDVKSIKYFFDIFCKDSLDLLKNPEELDLSKMKLGDLKEKLKELKDKKIYNYKCHQKYYDIFTSFYEKKEAIDFLLEKIKYDDINYLKDRIDPTKRRLTIKNIDDTNECLKGLKKIVNMKESEMLSEINKFDEKKFISYSKIYQAIIELDRNELNDDENTFKIVDKIITKASFIFKQDEEDFCYSDNGKDILRTNLEELIHIKNQISIQSKNNDDKGEVNNKEKKEEKIKDQFEIKCDKLLFFKNLVNNLEAIYEKMNILRIKGCNLPILINIKIEFPNVIYYLNQEETEFYEIRKFLMKAKNDYENQLNKIYKTEKYLRFLYGKIFRKVQVHLDGGDEIEEIQRYILNITDNNKEIKDGKIFNESGPKDWANWYSEYNKKIFDNISKYMISLFKNNDNQDIDNHYEKMLIKEKENKEKDLDDKIDTEKENTEKDINDKKYKEKEKGIYLYKCDDNSKEEYIVLLFLEILGQLPIAQNLLICSKETSIEEIQSFFYRAILCDKNTLFVVEIVESFTDYQYNKVFTYIDKLLSIKLSKNKNESINIDKLRTKEYLDSCIVFIYDNNLKNNLKELERYTNKNFDKNYSVNKANIYNNNEKNEDINNINDNFTQRKSFYKRNSYNEQDKDNSFVTNNSFAFSLSGLQNNRSFDYSELEKIKKNIKVITSEVCGLGKSTKIKKMIEDSQTEYYHLPLGGELTKENIYGKIIELFKKIVRAERMKKEQEINKTKRDKIIKDRLVIDYTKISIHIDLAESKEISLINEFLFSFLITRFYTYKEDIIYIPNNLNIYIEIPNCSQDYLSQIGILKFFPIENIVLGEITSNKNKNITNIKMEKLKLKQEIRDKFKAMIGQDKNEKIEEYIKKNIGIENYSYHQISIYIKLFISQYSRLEGNINLLDSGKKDITDKCLNNFKETSKLFTNGGFSKLLIQKKSNQDNNKFDLYLNAYENDLKNKNIKTPIFYIDQKTKKPKLLFLGEKNEDEKKEKERIKKNIKKDVDIVYLIDATGSMGREIEAANEKVKEILKELNTKFEDKNLSFNFGAVFYRDKIDSKDDENDSIPLTEDMDKLKKFISTMKADGGGDIPEDWVGGYNLVLNQMKWRNGIKLVIHIADAGAHGKEFTSYDKYPDEGPKLCELIKKCVEKNINIVGFKIGNEPEQSFEKIKEIYDEHKLSKDVKDNGQFIDIYNFNREKALDDFYNLVLEATSEVVNPSFKYLKRLKQMLNLPNEIEESKVNEASLKKKKSSDKIKTSSNELLLSLTDILKKDSDNYVITEDNYKKMVLLIYRIQANVPVIIMGETGCGKTALIKKLSQIINNGENLVYIIKIHPGIDEKEICKEMINVNKKARNQKLKENKKKELWVFFDEINTCLSLTLLTEIFINRTFNGEKLEDNIRLIGACNPYRQKVVANEKIGLVSEEDIINDDHLVYKVQPLPQSLLYYVFSFGSISDEDEKKYIYSITANKLFNFDEEEMHELTAEIISQCHIFLRDTFKDPSIVSLREINRFTKCVEFFEDYFLKKNNTKKSDISYEQAKVYKIKSIICSIYLCYYIRLINKEQRAELDNKLQKLLLDLVNLYSKDKNEDDDKKDLLNSIKYEPLKQDIRGKSIKHFSDFLGLEEDFLLDQIDLSAGIGKNQLLKENVFLLFVSVCTKIPLIIVGKPGTGKSLSSKLITNSMRGVYSKNPFFRKYPQIIQIYFQGSKSNIPEDVEKLFKRAENLYDNFKNKNPDKKGDDIPIYMILFDELGLAEKSPKNPLKVLHHKLEYEGKTEGVCFVGISNYSLDAAKVNRALYLAVPNLEDNPDEVSETAKSIVDNISPELTKDKDNMIIFDIISRAYCEYKNFLIYIKKIMVLKKFLNDKKEIYKNKKKSLTEIESDQHFKYLLMNEDKIKTEFHGNRDFYNIIKSVALDGSKLTNISDEKQIVDIIESYIERNFGGIYYEIDADFEINADFDFDLENKEDIEKRVKQVLGDKIKKRRINDTVKESIIKVNSVYIFKHIYNLVCEEKAKNYKIQKIADNYDLNKCINDNINDINSRYLLLEIKSNLSSLIIENIKVQNPDKRDKIKSLNGSPFQDDNNNDYKFGKINEIQDCAAEPDKIMILQNLNNIQPYLYDLYNMNYKIIDEQKYVRICLENFSEQDTPVSDSFRIIILVDRKFIDSVDMAFLNRLEKMQIIFSDLLNDEQKNAIKSIIKTIELKETVKKKKMNYDLKSLLINCSEEEIGGLFYNLFIESKKEKKNIKEIEDKIYTKISNILPQDIIAILKDENIIKQKYYEKNYYNFRTYIRDIEAKINNLNNYKISIIYTFSNIVNVISGYNNDMTFMISEIKSENQLKNRIEEMKTNEINGEQNNKIISIQFEQFNSDKIQFISDFILTYCKDDGYNYIFLVHITRKFFSEGNKERIYSIPNINKDINQLFIDNLNGPSELTLKLILTNNIKDIMFESGSSLDEETEFKKSLIKFVCSAINEKNKTRFLDNLNEDEYSNELLRYMENNKDFKKSLIRKAKELIDEDKIAKGDCGSLIDKMLKENYINKNSVDLISCVIDYIKENIYNKNLEIIFTFLEHYNFLTTLLEIDKVTNKNKIEQNIIIEIKDKILSEIKTNEENLDPKFLFGYNIPGFIIFYNYLSELLNKNFTFRFLHNEKKLRKYIGSKPDKIKDDFHEEEESLLNDVLEEINKNKIKFQFYFDLIKKISPDLVLKDYIKFYLDKYKDKADYCESCINIIELLLNLRFSIENSQIINDNKSNPINILLIKILWIESNSNYIINILTIFEHSKNIINHDKDGKIMFKMIEDSIKDEKFPIKYIVDPNSNPEHTIEVNECFYKLLASLCLSITSDDIKLTDSMDHLENFKNNEVYIMNYCEQLKEINNILQYLNDELFIFLNELYIIDELYKIIDCKVLGVGAIEEIRKQLRKSSFIIQSNKNSNLGENLKSICNLLKKEINKDHKDKYYDILKYLFIKEIKKVNDVNYHTNILDALIKEKEVIKNSKDIFQILLKPYFKEFKHTQKKLCESQDSVVILLDKNLAEKKQDHYFALSETLLYFFEKNSLIYLKDNYKSLHKTPTDIFKDCFKYLNADLEKEEKYKDKSIHITQIFCLGYIKAFCYFFIKMHDKSEFKPNEIIEVINKYDKYNIIKMIKIYLYKIIYYQNNQQIDVFLKHNIKEKYKLSKYNNFKKFFKFKDEEQSNYLIDFLDNNNYKNVYDIIVKYKNDGYTKIIEEKDINEIKKAEEESIENNLSYDTFYLVAYNLILSKLNRKDFDTEIYNKFYKNICEPLFKNGMEKVKDNKLLALMQILFDSEKYSKFKSDYKIESKYIDSLLYGFRYCLNELSEEYKGNYIYSSLYNKSKIGYLKEKFYPGSDTKDEPYYGLYYNIENHFKQKSNEGCFICLCNEGYYHSIPSGFPGKQENGITCPKCKKEIGSKEKYLEVKDSIDEKENKMLLVYEPIEREKYFRIFDDDEEIEALNRKKDKRNMLKKINYMTREKFKQDYIEPLYKKEKGLNIIDENKFKKENKVIRNLSQISYRLLNYILYSHLFFARLITNLNDFDNYLPKGMSWFGTIKECFILLQKELEKKGIKKTEIFMNAVFKELFIKLHEKECIDKYIDLIDFEDDLEKIIQEKIDKTKELIDKLEEIEKENCKDKTSPIALLKELYNKDDYDQNEYPYYEYFYYSDYPDENYIEGILKHKAKNDYPILFKYLEYKTHPKRENELYSSDNFITFNKVLNLLNDQYSHEIARDRAEKLEINKTDIYQQNPELINEFIKIYNKSDYKYKDLNANKNYICDFVLDENNKYGKTYKKIYEKFAEKQNEKLKELFDIKWKQGYNSNFMMKINIQSIKEDEIFSYNTFKHLKFIEVMFNSSYRKIIDTLKYENYNEFVIFLDLLEKELTDLLLGNKKLLNCELIEFKYKDEEFSYQINDLITNFECKYNTQDIDDDDKLVIYDYVQTYNGNNYKYINFINDFIILIEYLTKIRNDENEKVKIDESTNIYEVLSNLKGISNDFINTFKNKNYLIVKKVSKLYDYYLKLIFKYVKKDIEQYQEKKEIEESKEIEEKNKIKEKVDKEKKDEKPYFNLEDKTIKKINDYFSKEDLIITKEALLEALKLFMTIILYREKDKENKIKLNKNNIVGYLKEQDLWENNNIKIKEEKFMNNLSKIKSFNIKIKEILWLYYYLTDKKEEDFDSDIKEKYKKYLENLKKAEKEKINKKDNDKKKSDKENNKSKNVSKNASRSSSKSSSRSSLKSDSRSSLKSDSRSSSKSKSRSSSKSKSRNSSKSNSRNSSKSNSRNSSKNSSRNSSKSGSRKSSRKSSVNS